MPYQEQHVGSYKEVNVLEKVLKKTVAIGLGTVMALSSFAVASAATTADELVIQENSSETGTVALGKILTVNQDNKFPKVNDFIYSIERVEAWENANVNSAQSGATIAVANMPRPTASSTQNHVVYNDDNGITYVTIGDFTQTADAAGTYVPVADTARVKQRRTPVNITFDRAGYYVYKVKEVGSVPNTANSSSAYKSATKNVKGIDYDDNEYFVVFYVCNKMDSNGNTINGVYVHNITSWTNTAGSEDYKPNLSDIQNVSDIKNAAPDGQGGRTDATLGTNGGQVNADGTVTHDDLGKVGISTTTVEDPDPTAPDDDPVIVPNPYSTAPNNLEAFRMWNGQSTQDVVLKENVKGNLGDKTKLFDFEVTLTGLENSQAYTTTVATAVGEESTVNIEEVTTGTEVKTGNVVTGFTTDENGNATFTVKLKDDDILVINALPVGATYKMEQKASDHFADYGITSTNTSTENPPVIAKVSDANAQSDKALSTAVETVNRTDETITVLFTDTRTLATPTGMAISFASLALVALAIGMGVLLLKRKNESTVEDID